jgi:hypothetical protein
VFVKFGYDYGRSVYVCVCVGDANPTSFTLKESTRLDIKKWWETIEDALGKPLLSNDHRKTG